MVLIGPQATSLLHRSLVVLTNFPLRCLFARLASILVSALYEPLFAAPSPPQALHFQDPMLDANLNAIIKLANERLATRDTLRRELALQRAPIRRVEFTHKDARNVISYFHGPFQENIQRFRTALAFVQNSATSTLDSYVHLEGYLSLGELSNEEDAEFEVFLSHSCLTHTHLAQDLRAYARWSV
jgi:hypothetical protein